MLFQATQNGLAEQWPAVKKAYAEANDLLGDIVKVTPSSKTCGDLAQFMVTNGLSADDVREKASSGSLNFPSSVVEFFQGALAFPSVAFRSRCARTSCGVPRSWTRRSRDGPARSYRTST